MAASFRLGVKIDTRTFDKKLQSAATVAARDWARQAGKIMADNFTNVAGKDFSGDYDTNVLVLTGDKATVAVVTWGVAGDAVSQLNTGQYQAPIPDRGADEPISSSVRNPNGIAALFPSRAGSRAWIFRKPGATERVGTPRNYDRANVDYVYETKQIDEMLKILKNSINRAFS